jgi:outer membrane biosynthesis protein TonB
MPDRLTPRVTVLLVVLAFSMAFGLQALGKSAAPKAAVDARAASNVEQPGPRPELSLTSADSVPALRDPRKPKPKPKPKRKPKRHVVARPEPAVRVVATPTATPAPAPTSVPTPAAPRYVPPARTPAPTPKSTPEPAGDFDSSGDAGSSGTP